MAKKIDEPDKLMDLVLKIDESPTSDFADQTESAQDLSDEERLRLDRLRGALNFLNDIRSDDQGTTAENSIAAVSIETVDGHLADTWHGNADQKTVKAGDENQGDIDRFRIMRLLGKGGFAKVWLAHDPRLDRQVAVKILNPSLYSSEDVAARFDREAQAAAVLSHPNIVPVFECGHVNSDRYNCVCVL